MNYCCPARVKISVRKTLPLYVLIWKRIFESLREKSCKSIQISQIYYSNLLLSSAIKSINIFVGFVKICKISVRRTLPLYVLIWKRIFESLREKSCKSIQISQIYYSNLLLSSAIKSINIFVGFVKICKISVRRTLPLYVLIWKRIFESLREKSCKSIQISQIYYSNLLLSFAIMSINILYRFPTFSRQQ